MLTNKIKSLMPGKRALRHGTLVLLDQGTLSLANFAVGVLLARAVTKENYSAYVIGWSLIFVVFSINRSLVNTPFTIYYPRQKDQAIRSYFGSTILSSLLLTTLALLIIFKLSTLQYFAGSSIAEALPIVAWAIIPICLRDFTRAALLAQLKIRQSVSISLISSIILASATGILFFLNELNTVRTFYVIALTQAFASLVMITYERKGIEWKMSELLPTIKRHLRIGKWLFAGSLGYAILVQIYPWLILHYSGAENVAIIGVAGAFASMPGTILRGLDAYLLSRMSHSLSEKPEGKELVKLLQKSIALLFFPYLGWLVVAAFLGDYLITLIYSHSYSGNGTLITLVVLSSVMWSVSTPLVTALQVLEKANIVTLSIVLSAIVAAIAGTILISNFGLIGAGLTMVIVATIGVTTRWLGFLVAIRKTTPIPLS